MVFFDYSSPTTASCDRSVWAARLFYNAIESHMGIPLSISDAKQCIGAADAFATSNTAGIGGWWVDAGLSPCAADVHWFSFQLSREDLPASGVSFTTIMYCGFRGLGAVGAVSVAMPHCTRKIQVCPQVCPIM